MSLVSNDEKKKSSPADNLPEPNLNKCLNDRSGQSQEGICFEELAELISVSLADMSSLTVKPEKCAIIQETVSQIHRIQQAIGESDELQESEVSSSNSSILNAEVLGPLLLETLDGFLVLVNTDGKIEVVSENISYFLKYTKDDLLGKSIYNIIHVGDHARFSSNLLPMSIGNGFGWTSDPGSGTSKSRTFNCRFLIKPPEDPEESMEEKQTRVSQYENMQISTVLLPHFTERSDSPESETSEVQNLLFCVARRIPPSERNQNLSGIEQFTTRLDVAGKILAIDTSGVSSTYSQYLNKDLVERTVQELCHSSDLHKLKHHLNETLQVGSNTSGIFRLRIAHEKYIHVQTKSKRVIYNPLTSEQEFIMATHSIISRDPDLPDVNQNNGSSSASGGSSSSSVGTSILTSSATAVTTVNSSCSSSLYSSLTSLPSAHHDFSLDDLGLDFFSSSSWKLTTENSREGLPTSSTVPSLSPATSASSGSNSRMTLGSIQKVQLSNSAFTTEMSPVSRSLTLQVTSPGSTGVSRVTSLSSFSFNSLQCPPSNGRATPVTMGLKKMENETSDVNSGNRNISLISFSDHQMSLGTNPKLRNLLTQSSEKTDSSSGITSPLSKMFNVSQSSLATGPENGLEMREMPVATGDDNSNGSSRNVILRELLNQDEDGVLELPGKSRFPSGSGKSGMSLDMDSFRSDTNREASKRPVNNNNMLRKLLNSEVESDRNSRKSQDMLIQQLLKAESPEKNENSVGGDANSQSSSSDQIFKDFGLGSSHSSNSLSLPTSLSEALSSLSKRKSDDNTDSGTKPPSKRPAIQHPHLAGQNPMLASMLAQTPKTEPSVPTTIANSIMSQLPQDRLPKNLEKKLIQTPCVVMTSGSSSISTQHGTGHTMSTNHSLLHQDVVTADSRGHVTLSHHPVTTVNPSLGQLPQHGFTTQHQQYQGFLSRILNSSDGSQLTRALAAASTNATISNQSGQSIYNNNFQLSNQVFQQPNKSLTLSDLLGDVSSFDSVVGLTAQSQTSDPMLSQILDEVWSMQQEMETTPIDDNMIRKILDEVFEQPSGSSTSESVPSNNQSVNTVQDVHEKLAINAIQQQLMSYETTARSSTTTAHAAPSSSYIQSSGMGLGTVVPPNIVVNFSSTHNYPSVPSLPTYSSGTQAGHRLKAQNSGVLTGVQQGVAVGNFQRPGGSQFLNSGGGGLTPEVYHRLLERRQKMLQHQKRLRAQQQQQQQVVQSSQTASEPMTPVSASVFPENTNDILNNTVAPNVTLQRFNGITDQQLSPRYNTTLLGQTGQSQLSPGHQPPYSPLSQQSFPNPSPPVTSGYSQQQHRQPTYLPSSPVTVTGGKPQSPHLQAHSSQTQWNQRTAPNTTTTGSVQQQNPMLNAQLSQSSFSGQGRFITQAQRQIQVRSLSSPNSVTSQINSSFPNQSDGQFQPQSPGHLYQQPSQAPSKQQRIQRVVSIPSHVNSPRTPHGGYVSSDQVVSPQPQMSPSYTSPGNNYASTSGTSDTSRFSFDQQSSQIYGLSSVDRGQGKSSTGGMTSEYVRQELRAMVGAKTQQQQQTQAQQFQYSLSGGSNPEGSVSTPNHQTFNQAELDALVLSLDLGTGDSSSGLFPPSLLGVSNNQCSISQVPSHSPRDEEPKPADEKKSLLQQLLQHTPEPC